MSAWAPSAERGMQGATSRVTHAAGRQLHADRAAHSSNTREKYIQEELAKRLGRRAAGLPEEDEEALKRRKIEEDLYAVPEQFKVRACNVQHPVEKW